VGYTDASGHTGHDAGRHVHISENRIEWGIRKAAEALFNDEMFALAGFEIVHDLGTLPERAMIRDRVLVGLEWARSSDKHLGRPLGRVPIQTDQIGQ
jgi:hypothetical protein